MKAGIKAIFLDRDGVLNHAPVIHGRPKSPQSISELVILESAKRACAQFKAEKYLQIAITNQPDIARGLVSEKNINDINTAVREALSLDDILTCPHDNNDNCQCRKPAPGMLLAAAAQYGISLEGSVMVGDRWTDIEAGKAVGCKTVFIDYGYQEQRPENVDFNCTNLLDAAPWIIEMLKS
jgi:D-glycero-D-manno-heptose 1,7-bisphosphate phosphatase